MSLSQFHVSSLSLFWFHFVFFWLIFLCSLVWPTGSTEMDSREKGTEAKETVRLFRLAIFMRKKKAGKGHGSGRSVGAHTSPHRQLQQRITKAYLGV